ncbi:MAG: aldo/keto reductase [Thermoleophilia bacterium]|nr:aldo/keto reductase [Thermoleophilia bacterium]
MQYRRMGKSGLKVSAITLGTLWFGSKVDEPTALQIVDRALGAGVNCIDTADIYGKDRWDTPERGPSEEIVGRALKGRRQSVVLATKVCALTGPGVNDRGLSRKHITESVHESLRRLRTDYIDVYYLHEPDYETPLEESLETLDDLVRQGKILYVGLSNYYAWQVCKALWIADKKNLAGVDCIQMVYNLVARDAELEMTRLCEAEGIGINVWGALAGGMLSGKFLEYDPSGPPPDGVKPYPCTWQPRYFEAVTRLKAIAGGRSLSQFSLAWMLRNPEVSSVVCGVSSLGQLEENLGSLDMELSAEDLEACDDVWRQLRPAPVMFYARGYGIDFK